MRDIQQLIDNEDAIGLAAWVRRGEVQPVELVEAVIERIEQVEPRPHSRRVHTPSALVLRPLERAEVLGADRVHDVLLQ